MYETVGFDAIVAAEARGNGTNVELTIRPVPHREKSNAEIAKELSTGPTWVEILEDILDAVDAKIKKALEVK